MRTWSTNSFAPEMHYNHHDYRLIQYNLLYQQEMIFTFDTEEMALLKCNSINAI